MSIYTPTNWQELISPLKQLSPHRDSHPTDIHHFGCIIHCNELSSEVACF